MAVRPCDKGNYCSHLYYDYSENCNACDIDYDGENCPYIKLLGKKKYEEEMGLYWKKFDCAIRDGD